LNNDSETGMLDVSDSSEKKQSTKWLPVMSDESVISKLYGSISDMANVMVIVMYDSGLWYSR